MKMPKKKNVQKENIAMSNDTGMRTIAKIYIYNGMFNCFGDHENTKPFYTF